MTTHRERTLGQARADLTAFLLLLRENPTLMPPVPGIAGYALQIEHRRLDERHTCIRCGGQAQCAFVADTSLGPRWLDLCHHCAQGVYEL